MLISKRIIVLLKEMHRWIVWFAQVAVFATSGFVAFLLRFDLRISMHLQPLYSGCECYGGEVAEDLFRRGICLPSSSSLTAEDQLYVINCVRNAAGANPLSQFDRRHENTQPINDNLLEDGSIKYAQQV